MYHGDTLKETVGAMRSLADDMQKGRRYVAALLYEITESFLRVLKVSQEEKAWLQKLKDQVCRIKPFYGEEPLRKGHFLFPENFVQPKPPNVTNGFNGHIQSRPLTTSDLATDTTPATPGPSRLAKARRPKNPALVPDEPSTTGPMGHIPPEYRYIYEENHEQTAQLYSANDVRRAFERFKIYQELDHREPVTDQRKFVEELISWLAIAKTTQLLGGPKQRDCMELMDGLRFNDEQKAQTLQWAGEIAEMKERERRAALSKPVSETVAPQVSHATPEQEGQASGSKKKGKKRGGRN